MIGPGGNRTQRADEAQYDLAANVGQAQEALRHDFDVAKQFLEFLDPTEDRHTFQLTADLPGTSKAVRFGTLESQWRWLVAANQEGAGVHVMVNAGDHKGRKKKNVSRVRAVVVDLDGAPLPTSFLIAPHAVVETSPGRYHLYYRASIPLDCFKAVQKGLAATFGGDTCVNDLSRVFRLPGLLHMKGTPHLVRLEQVKPDAAPLTLDELSAAFPFVQQQLSLLLEQRVERDSVSAIPECPFVEGTDEAKVRFAEHLLGLVAAQANRIQDSGRHDTLRNAAWWCLCERLSRTEAESLCLQARDLLPPRSHGPVPDNEVLEVVAWTYDNRTPGEPSYADKSPQVGLRRESPFHTAEANPRTLAQDDQQFEPHSSVSGLEATSGIWREYQLDQLPSAEEVEWLWDQRIPRASVSLLGGAPGVGKSALAFALGLSVATGRPFLGYDVAQGPVLYFDVDASADTQGPLLKKVMRGLGLSEEQLRDKFKYFDLQPDRIQPLDLGHLRMMKRAAQEMQAVMIILDAWTSAFWNTRSNSAEDVAGKMAELRSLAKDGFTILVLDHLPKPTANGPSAIERGLIGSIMKPANARSVYLLLPHSVGANGNRVLALHTWKNNASRKHLPLGIEPIWMDGLVSFQTTDLPQGGVDAPGKSAATSAILEVLSNGAGTPKHELIKMVRVRASVESRTIESALANLIKADVVIDEKDSSDGRRRFYRLVEASAAGE
jgi:hypothetical protein